MIEVLPEECPNRGHLPGLANFEPWGVAVARGHLSIPLSRVGDPRSKFYAHICSNAARKGPKNSYFLGRENGRSVGQF